MDGVFLATRSAIPLLKNNGGSIINIGSTSSFLGNPLRSAYSATKWGLIGLTKTWAMEYGENNIRVNGIAPGFVATKLTEVTFKNKKRYDDSLKRIPLGRWGTPEDMGELACFLCSDGASYITGQMITSDGGMSL